MPSLSSWVSIRPFSHPTGRGTFGSDFFCRRLIGSLAFNFHPGASIRVVFNASNCDRPARREGELILAVFATGILLNIFTGYGQLCLPSPDQRFLLPLYPGIFLLLGFLLSKIYLSGRIITILILVPLLFFNVFGNLNHTVYLYSNGWIFLNRAAYQSYRQNELREAQLIDSLKRMGLQRLYAEDSLGKLLMIKSREALIFSNAFQEDFLKYAQMVDGLEPSRLFLARAIILFFEENLKAVGGGYRKSALPGGYQLFSEFQTSPRPLDRDPPGSMERVSQRKCAPAPWAFDNDIATEWRAPITPGSYYLLDLGKSERVGKVEYIPTSYRDVPSGLSLGSLCRWTNVAGDSSR